MVTGIIHYTDTMGSKNRVPSETDDLVGLLADDQTRHILAALANRPRNVDELIDYCDISARTVYRRLDHLRERNLVNRATTVGDDGQQHAQYWTPIDEIDVLYNTAEESIDVEIETNDEDDAVPLFSGLRGAGRERKDD